MSETTDSPLPPPPPPPSPAAPPSTDHNDNYSVKDVIMWRRKRMSVGVLAAATVLYVVMEVYGFNFITVASWTAIFLLSSLFAWANIFKLIYKHFERRRTKYVGVVISENTATGIAIRIREFSEEAARWMFKIGAESEWYVFVATIAGLWLLSIIGSSSDLLTLLYVGTVMGMTVPVMWLKYDHKIREYGRRLQIQSKRFYSMMDEKVLHKLRNKAEVNPPKEKKEE
ncbi:hypothetical protein OSB04_007489 [Centaurea solstitialis]|uniref:Reticulon-like protein n=1 Tax=Centaurea solstitialis TaxID=347529 RepID=A0AA38TLN9_9ASTR|nr:hypothetical protein OSB04_007489 [Centaurea solstitialis]